MTMQLQFTILDEVCNFQISIFAKVLKQTITKKIPIFAKVLKQMIAKIQILTVVIDQVQTFTFNKCWHLFNSTSADISLVADTSCKVSSSIARSLTNGITLFMGSPRYHKASKSKCGIYNWSHTIIKNGCPHQLLIFIRVFNSATSAPFSSTISPAFLAVFYSYKLKTILHCIKWCKMLVISEPFQLNIHSLWVPVFKGPDKITWTCKVHLSYILTLLWCHLHLHFKYTYYEEKLPENLI